MRVNYDRQNVHLEDGGEVVEVGLGPNEDPALVGALISVDVREWTVKPASELI